ncbi:MAG: DUF3990 domain-containing protein [Muribaculaceae bacterium]|nr:DUF3990 domain-containing protein [Muribaculaceae bacterium]
MRLYHGSFCKISEIDLTHSRNYKDFGAGFYLTPDFGRAVKMAMRSVELNNNGSPEVNSFIFNKTSCPEDIAIKEFKTNTWEWARFIMQNRDKSLIPPYKHDYDIIIGPVADSIVDPVIESYKSEFGNNYLELKNLQILAQRLKYPGTKYTQYCFCTPKAIEQLIKD